MCVCGGGEGRGGGGRGVKLRQRPDNQKLAMIKKKQPFPIRGQRVITYSQENVEVQSVNSVEPEFISSLLKKSTTLFKNGASNTKNIRKQSQKGKERMKLIVFFEVPEDTNDFYTLIQMVNGCGKRFKFKTI